MSIKPQIKTFRKAKSIPVFGWAGHPQSLHLLKTIEPEIIDFQDKYRNHKLIILSGEKDLKFNFKYKFKILSTHPGVCK